MPKRPRARKPKAKSASAAAEKNQEPEENRGKKRKSTSEGESKRRRPDPQSRAANSLTKDQALPKGQTTMGVYFSRLCNCPGKVSCKGCDCCQSADDGQYQPILDPVGERSQNGNEVDQASNAERRGAAEGQIKGWFRTISRYLRRRFPFLAIAVCLVATSSTRVISVVRYVTTSFSRALTSTAHVVTGSDTDHHHRKPEAPSVDSGSDTEPYYHGPETPDVDSDSREAVLGTPAATKKKGVPQFKSRWSDADTQEYRDGYPGKADNPDLHANADFYMNKIQCKPDGDYIDNIHILWFGDYQRLERHHGYIQWLFPIRENGMNYQAQELQEHEAKAIRDDPEAQERVLKSYELMLDFYGMKLKSRDTGQVERSKNWKERFQHLNKSFHNYLRITRILKSLGELGFENLKKPFLEFILEESLKKGTLRNCHESCRDYWLQTLRDDADREALMIRESRMSKGHF